MQSRILPLKPISLQSKPAAKRAIAWSCDGELAVAADDSVHILVPEFPRPDDHDGDGEQEKRYGQHDEVQDGVSASRAQFSQGSRHFPVSFPPPNPYVNEHLFNAAAGIPFPAMRHTMSEIDPVTGAKRVVQLSGADLADSAGHSAGAGSGPLTGVGSTMNHVVGLAWAPSGIGRNRRPVLAVLTASGALVVYGEGGGGGRVDNTSAASALGLGRPGVARDVQSWVLLWGVGERLIIPGQDENGENIISFAWARDTPSPSSDRTLLAYMTDQQEVVIVYVRYGLDRPTAANDSHSWQEAWQGAWHVREVARFMTSGPHPVVSGTDPDHVPCGTSFALRWSPWAVSDQSRSTCMLSYIGRNYVGFRRITVNSDLTVVDVGRQDSDGLCLFLSTDAFLEWEGLLWNIEGTLVCRGIIATPWQPKPFQIIVSDTQAPKDMPRHDTHECGTTYPKPGETGTNPIQDLAIHHPDPTNRTAAPTYTLVRLSATATNSSWYQTNGSGNPAEPEHRPQWAAEIAQRVQHAVPAYLAPAAAASDEQAARASRVSREGGDGDGGIDSDMGSDDDDDDDDDGNTEEEGEEGAGHAGGRHRNSADIHPHVMKIWGLAASPGGGTTAVLASVQGTQLPERGGFYNYRSRIMFGWRGLPTSEGAETDQDNDATAAATTGGGGSDTVKKADSRLLPPGLTTEGKLWEWMYGRGPNVPGVTSSSLRPRPASAEEPAQAQAKGSRHELFKRAADAQTCQICEDGTPVIAGQDSTESSCLKGHRFDTCSTSGLAIQAPGISRACGVCGSRCLDPDELVRRVDLPSATAAHSGGTGSSSSSRLPPREEDATAVRAKISTGVCGRCGGKFKD